MFFGGRKSERSQAAQMVNPRRSPRHATASLGCCLGLILDLSETGMQIEFHGKPPAELGAQMRLTVKSPIQSLSVTGQIVWVKTRFMRAGRLGIRFVNTPPALAKALVELACHGFVDTTSLATHEDVADQSGSPGSQSKGRSARSVQASVVVEDYYGALGVSPTADAAQIHAAYRKIAMELHPDINKAPDAQTRFSFISRAYAVLKDPAKRLAFDDALRAGGAAAQGQSTKAA